MLKRLIDWFAFRKYKGISKEMSQNDLMYKASGHNYMHFGKAALDCVLDAMEKAGKKDAQNILVLPCGHGRETRFFKAHFPNAKIVACDIDKDGVDFCTETFGVEGIYSNREPGQIRIPGKFDLIWCGSLVTHLDESYWREFLQFFSEHLNETGILVFSTHGCFMAEKFRSGAYDLGIDGTTKKEMLKQYDQIGFGYGDYFGQNDYGISLSSKGWVCDLISEMRNLQLFDYVECGWFYNHDTAACVRKEDFS